MVLVWAGVVGHDRVNRGVVAASTFHILALVCRLSIAAAGMT